EEGLVVPAIMNCESKSLPEIAKASRDLVERVNKGVLHPDEYTGGTFSVSNLGMFDVDSFAAIIHPPQSAVLAVGTVKKKPVVKDDQIVIAQVMNATISVDHRVADGAQAAQFLVEVKKYLENPASLLV
ncbi:MAG: 2-oxo acid dehydrogenase subunit E2, partial [Chloroflexi bacterium]|nr:2-oxo acid dehydrogenase subunit E2 [Chloroflexota bacterium]